MTHLRPELFPDDNTLGFISQQQLEEQNHGLPFRPPSDAFYESLSNPRRIESSGLEYATYTFNQEADPANSKPPLVVCLPFEDGASSKQSSRELFAFASYTTRRIINIDLPATGASDSPSWLKCWRTSLNSIGEATNDILDKMGEGEVDFAGICLGGVMATRSATMRGKKARNLVTIATPGFDTNSLARFSSHETGWSSLGRKSRASDRRTLRVAATFDTPSKGRGDTTRLPEPSVSLGKRVLLFARVGRDLSRNAPFQLLDRDLHPDTRFHDIVGTDDVMNDWWKGHLAVHDQRHQQCPGQSTLTILEAAGHDWPIIRATLAAYLVEQALERA